MVTKSQQSHQHHSRIMPPSSFNSCDHKLTCNLTTMGCKSRRLKRVTPTIRTLRYFRRKNIPCRVVERWIKLRTGGGIRQDLWHCDIVALIGQDTLGIQAGPKQHHAEKVTNALIHPDVKLWLSSPYRSYIVLTWGKYVKRRKDGTKSLQPDWRARATRLVNEDGKIIAKEWELK